MTQYTQTHTRNSSVAIVIGDVLWSVLFYSRQFLKKNIRCDLQNRSHNLLTDHNLQFEKHCFAYYTESARPSEGRTEYLRLSVNSVWEDRGWGKKKLEGDWWSLTRDLTQLPSPPTSWIHSRQSAVCYLKEVLTEPSYLGILTSDFSL